MMKKRKIELGVTTFGETTRLYNQEPVSHHQRIKNLVEEIELADKVGLDIYAVGEHHREDFAVSVPEIILAAGAVNTKKIRLSSAVTVLSSSDPIRIYQNFASVDALSDGRAEIMAGKGSFIESFPLFGYDLKDYQELFEEKLEMLLEIRKNEKLNWNGRFTPRVENRGVYPRAVQQELPIWIATGGNPQSVRAIAQQNLPMTLAMIGGAIVQFKSLMELYRKVGNEYFPNSENLKIATHSWGYIGEDNHQALEEYFLPTKALVDQIATERAHWQPLSWEQYLNSTSSEGTMFVGSPEKIIEKIIYAIETLDLDRLMLHIPTGSMPHEKIMKSIQLFGEKIAPVVRRHFSNI